MERQDTDLQRTGDDTTLHGASCEDPETLSLKEDLTSQLGCSGAGQIELRSDWAS